MRTARRTPSSTSPAPRPIAARGAMRPSASTSPKIHATIAGADPADHRAFEQRLAEFGDAVQAEQPLQSRRADSSAKNPAPCACVLKFQPPSTTEASSTRTIERAEHRQQRGERR